MAAIFANVAQPELPCDAKQALALAGDGEAIKLTRLTYFLALNIHAQFQAQQVQGLVSPRKVRLFLRLG